jgi:hypothetical protein
VQNNQPQIPTHERKLDKQRAQSMEDEGGVSGALVDAREHDRASMRSRSGAKKVWALAALGAGFWLMSLALRRLVSRG